MRILVVNAGSSSLKLSVFDDDRLVGSETLVVRGATIEERAVEEIVARYRPVDAVGHRVVHGGTEFTRPVLVTSEVRDRLGALTDLAPLHQPKSLRALDLVNRLVGDVPAVATFDTAFHAHLPAPAATYALPVEWRQRWGLRRFGFHGLSHAYATRRVAELADPDGPGRLVTCHLGAGASLAAIRDGRSVDTTMGFTPLEGLVMATRSGSVDPGLLVWLEEHTGMPPSELASALEHRSGLLGLAGTPDMAALLVAEANGNPEAALAVEVYLHRLRAGIAAMAAALGGLDSIVFTGGVGERAPEIRARAAAGLEFLGLRVDAERNRAPPGDREIGARGAPARAYVIAAREDLEIARAVRELLG
jgi:acetate kinase